MALTVAGLKGRVVLVDFWTTRSSMLGSLPHVEAWNAAYAADGLTVVVSTRRSSRTSTTWLNITRAAAELGAHYPIAVDTSYATWNTTRTPIGPWNP